MSEKTKILLYALWVAHPVLQTAIGVAMLRRGQHRVSRYFFAYIVTQIPIFAVLFPTYLYGPSAYFCVSWFTTAISMTLGFLLIYEAFLDIFRPFPRLCDLGTMLFKWPGLVLLFVAGVLAVSTIPPDVKRSVRAMKTAQSCIRMIQVGMVLFILFFACHLGVSRRRRSFGIVLGFGIFAVVELALISSWAGYRPGYVAMSFINMIAYNSALLIWLCYSLANKPAGQAAVTLLPPQRRLSSIHYPVPTDPLMPLFEGMSRRTLAPARMSPPPIPADGANRELKTAYDMFIAAYRNITTKYPDLGIDNPEPDEAITDYIRTQIHS